MQKQDPDEIAVALKSIEKKIPPGALQDKDKETITKAKEQMKKLESSSRRPFHYQASTCFIRLSMDN